MAQIKLASINKEELCTLLKQAGCRTISKESLERDILAGAPVNPDGTIHLLNYIAWIVKEGASSGIN